MIFNYGIEFPYAVFFKPNKNFFNLMVSRYRDVGILEAGAGVGHTLKEMQDYGKSYGVSAMAQARGFDLHRRDSYAKPEFEFQIFNADAVTATIYHQGLQVLVCRPDHSGWVEDLLDKFLDGDKVCKRFIYVGLEENIKTDFREDQLLKVDQKFAGVGADEEVMYVWEIS